MSEENVGVVRRAFAALGDAKPEDLTDDVLREFFDPAVEWVPVPQGVLAGGSYLDSKAFATSRPTSSALGMTFAPSPRKSVRRMIVSSPSCE